MIARAGMMSRDINGLLYRIFFLVNMSLSLWQAGRIGNKTICSLQQIKTGSWKKRRKRGSYRFFTYDIIDDLVNGFSPAGIIPYTDLLEYAHERNFHCIAVNSAQRKNPISCFSMGIWKKRSLQTTWESCMGTKRFTLSRVVNRSSSLLLNPDMAERIMYSCRIYGKSHFTNHYSFSILEVGKKADWVGKAIF